MIALTPVMVFLALDVVHVGHCIPHQIVVMKRKVFLVYSTMHLLGSRYDADYYPQDHGDSVLRPWCNLVAFGIVMKPQ